MGIPRLYRDWFKKKASSAIISAVPQFVSSLSFDLNGVIHEARKEIFGEDITDQRLRDAMLAKDELELAIEFEKKVGEIILRLVEALSPQDCLILAVDGPAPAAKQQQQRGRRERAASSKAQTEIFDRNAITPGTEVMMRLDRALTIFIGKYRNRLPPKVIYSSHLVPGEGEHKIMDYYRRGEATDGLAAKEGGVHVLYGLDADLIMLSLLAPIDNIILSRETIEEVIDIDQLKRYLKERMKTETAINDFVVMMFLMGNDFLPHAPSLERMSDSIETLIDTYAAGTYQLTVDNEINWTDMKLFLQQVAALEKDFLVNLASKETEYPSRFLKAAMSGKTFNHDKFRAVWYQNALGPKGKPEFLAILKEIIDAEISEVTPNRIEDMAIDYIRTMAWVYLYYIQGHDAINQEWAYLYYHAPMLADLSEVMNVVSDGSEEGIVIAGYEKFEGGIEFTALHQLVSVLPKNSIDLLPVELQPLFKDNSILRDYFPKNFINELDGKGIPKQMGVAITYNRRGGKRQGPKSLFKPKPPEPTSIIPLIDRQRIIEAVASVSFSIERVSKWLPANEEIYTRSVEESELLRTIEIAKKKHEEFLKRRESRGRGSYRGSGERGGERGAYRGTGYRGTSERGAYRGTNERGGYSRGTGYRGTGERGGYSRGTGYRGTSERGGYSRGASTRGSYQESRAAPGQNVVQRGPTTSATGEKVVRRTQIQTALSQRSQQILQKAQQFQQSTKPTFESKVEPVLIGSSEKQRISPEPTELPPVVSPSLPLATPPTAFQPRNRRVAPSQFVTRK